MILNFNRKLRSCLYLNTKACTYSPQSGRATEQKIKVSVTTTSSLAAIRVMFKQILPHAPRPIHHCMGGAGRAGKTSTLVPGSPAVLRRA